MIMVCNVVVTKEWCQFAYFPPYQRSNGTFVKKLHIFDAIIQISGDRMTIPFARKYPGENDSVSSDRDLASFQGINLHHILQGTFGEYWCTCLCTIFLL